jgi:beta-lactamase class A
MMIADYALDYATRVDAGLQAEVERIDAALRGRLGMAPQDAMVGVLDLTRAKLAMIHPDREDYAASVPKIGILLAYFQSHPEAAERLEAQTRRELGEMVKLSSNEMAAKYSQLVGLKRVQDVLNSYGFYDAERGGGIWCGKHYGLATERYPSPVGGHSHAATVRQLLRFYLLLEQGKLVSPAASRAIREIFEAPELDHLDDRFVKGLRGRELRIIRKSGWWENWLHDTAVVTRPGLKYVLVGMTNHPKGDDYLEALAPAVDDVVTRAG